MADFTTNELGKLIMQKLLTICFVDDGAYWHHFVVFMIVPVKEIRV